MQPCRYLSISKNTSYFKMGVLLLKPLLYAHTYRTLLVTLPCVFGLTPGAYDLRTHVIFSQQEANNAHRIKSRDDR